MGKIATVVKARPNDVDPAVFSLWQERLGGVRLFLGIESSTAQGLKTLWRGVKKEQNEQALAVLESQGAYTCFNMLLLDPDTTTGSLRTNLDFLERWAEVPSNFGRVELYAGTPLLARMQAEGRCSGDWMGWDYTLASPALQRIYSLFVRCFHARNFAPGALANRLQGTRFDAEIALHFHPAQARLAWREEAKALSKRLTTGSVAAMRQLIDAVEQRGPEADHQELVRTLSVALRQEEAIISAAAGVLEAQIQQGLSRHCRHTLPPSPRPLER